MRGCGGHLWLQGGGCAWLQGGHAWLWGVCMVVGGMRGCRGACMVAGACVVAGGHAWLLGGMHGCRGACMVAGGEAWLWGVCMVAGGWAWLGGMHDCWGCIGYDEIRSMSGRYTSYWNAFLFCKKLASMCLKE